VKDAGELERGGGRKNCWKGHGGLMAGDEDVHGELVDKRGDPVGIEARFGKSKGVRKFKPVAGIEV
jgi:hypothetical protein